MCCTVSLQSSILTHLYVCEYPQSNVYIMCYIPEDEDDGYFGQEQVPLTNEIKEILEEYPDGQIFKVCKQIILSTYVKIIWQR